MPHENKAHWGGSTKSPKPTYDIVWEVDFDDPPGVKLHAKFTIKHGWRGPHVAKELAEKWNNQNPGGPVAALYGATVDFAGHVAEMRFRVDGPPTHKVPDDCIIAHVVDHLCVYKD